MRLITHFLISMAALVVLNLDASAQTIWQPEPYTIITGDSSHTAIGNESVYTGDVNGDTFPDLFAFATYVPTGAFSYVAFFSDATGALSPNVGVTFVNPDPTNANYFARGNWNVGDVNGDNITDLIVSAMLEPYISGSDTLQSIGAVYIYFGENGISGVQEYDVRLGYPRDLIADSSRYPYGYPAIRFGWEFNVGDFNGDGIDDIVVTEHGGQTWEISDPAEAIDTVHTLPDTVINQSFQYVYLGGPTISSSSTPDYTLTPHFHNANAGSYNLGVGDWNGDGIEDLAVPAYGAEDVNVLGTALVGAVDSADTAEAMSYYSRKEQYGKVLFYYGASDISSWETYPDYVMSKNDTARGELSEGSQWLGFNWGYIGNHTIGDYNGDGYDDFVASGGWSVYNYIAATKYAAGLPRRYVYFGGPNFGEGPAGGFGSTINIDATNSLRFEYGASGGDVNGDGYDDYFYSGYTDSVGVDNNGARVNGQYYVYFGGPTVVDTGYVLFRQPQSDIEDGFDAFGIQHVVPIWDMNGDGANEWAASASLYGDFGGVYIYAGVVDTSTSVEKDPLGIAESYSLGQNYPNPFNPSTSIKFSLTSANRVVLKLYDVLGREVATLINENYSPGQYTYIFNTNEIGKQLASGTYFYRLTAGSFVSTKKMILLK